MHKFAPENAHRLERTERYELIRPRETLQRLGLRPGMRLLDVGAGTGFFSRPAASIVGPAGKVYAVDMSSEMLDALHNGGVDPAMEILHSGEYSIPLPAESADIALVAFVLHENPDRERLLDEIIRILTPDGRILVIEWKKQKEENGPPMAERLGEEDLVGELSRFIVSERGSLNDSHYYVILQGKKGVSR